MSEYEVPDEWITYTGEVNEAIFEFAARNTETEMEAIKRLCEEDNYILPGQDHTRQNTLYSDSSSDEQSTPPRVRNERRALMEPGKATPSAPPFNEAALAMPTIEEAAISAPTQAVAANQEAPVEVIPSASAAMDAPMGEPAFKEAAPSVHTIEEAAAPVAPLFQADRANIDAPIEILNEWSVFIAAEKARKAAAKSLEASNSATEARVKAEAAEFSGHHDAALLAAESVRYEICAAQSAQIALNAELYAAQVAEAFARVKIVADEEEEVVVVKAPPTNSVEKKE